MKLRKELTDVVVRVLERHVGSFDGKLTEEEWKEIEKRGIDIRVMSVFMDGSATYHLEVS